MRRRRTIVLVAAVGLAVWVPATFRGGSSPRQQPAAPASTRPTTTHITVPAVVCILGGHPARVDPISAARLGCVNVPMGGTP